MGPSDPGVTRRRGLTARRGLDGRGAAPSVLAWACAALVGLPGCAEEPVVSDPPPPACPPGQLEDADGLCVSERCGPGPWPSTQAGAVAEGRSVFHVAPWGRDDAEGTADDPLADVAVAADRAGEGGLVALAAGTYGANLVLDSDHDGVDIVGRCPELTAIEGGSDGEESTVRLLGGAIGFQGLTLRGGLWGVWVQPGGFGSVDIELTDVHVVGSRGAGIYLGGRANGRAVDLVVRDTEATADGSFGRGIDVEFGASFAVTGLEVDGGDNIGVYVSGADTLVTLQDATIRGLRSLGDATTGRGIHVQEGASLDASGLLLERNQVLGLYALDSGTRITLEDTSVRDTQPLEDGTFGSGILLRWGASLTASDLVVEGSPVSGIIATDSGTTVALAGATIGSAPSGEGAQAGRGVNVQGGASFSAVGLVLDGNRGAGLYASNPGTTVSLQDTTIRQTQLAEDGSAGRGLNLQDRATLDATGLSLEQNHGIGLYAADGGTAVTVVDSTVRGTRPLEDGTLGWGVEVAAGASLWASGLLIEENHDAGLVARGDGAEVTVEDTTVRATLPREDGTFGRGVVVQEEASFSATALLLEGNHEVGLIASGEGTVVALDDATIRGTLPMGDGTSGHGVDVLDGAALSASSLVLEGNQEAGLIAAGPGTDVTLEDATVRGTRLRADGVLGRGINVQGGASLSADGLRLEGNHSAGLYVGDEGTTCVLSDATIRDTQPQWDGSHGEGVAVQFGALLSASGLRLEGNHSTGLSATGQETLVDLQDTEVRGTQVGSEQNQGFGLVAQGEAVVTARDLRLLDNDGPGAYVVGFGAVSLEDLVAEGNGFAGAVLLGGGQLTVVGGTIRSSVPTAAGGGVGILAWDHVLPPIVDISGVSFSDLRGPGLYLNGVGSYRVTDCRFEDSGTAWAESPGGIFAANGVSPWQELPDGTTAGLLLADNEFSGIEADAVLLDASAATFDGNTFDAIESLAVYRQHCDEALEPVIVGAPPDSPNCQSGARETEPRLEFWIELSEVDVVE